jgi:coenzyme F420-reducing hydrogenase beta subunit
MQNLRLPQSWEEAKSWNQIVVRTDAGQKLIDLTRSKGVLEFRNVPGGYLDRLTKALLNKKEQTVSSNHTVKEV